MAQYGAALLTNGAAWLSRGGVAQYGAAWLSMVRRGSVNGAAWLSFMVRRGSVGSASACVRQARVRFSARHHWEVFPTEHTSNEEMERGISEWRWINVWYECD